MGSACLRYRCSLICQLYDSYDIILIYQDKVHIKESSRAKSYRYVIIKENNILLQDVVQLYTVRQNQNSTSEEIITTYFRRYTLENPGCTQDVFAECLSGVLL